MRYPADFPPESCAAVAAEKLRAGKDFDRTRSNPQPMQGGIGHLEGELRRYILRPFGVFVSEACKLGHKGVWSVDRIEEAALEFLRLSTIDAWYSKGYDRSGRAFGRDWIDNWTGGIQPELMRQLERSEHWRQFQDALIQVAEGQNVPASDFAPSERIGGTFSRTGEGGTPASKSPAATAEDEAARSAVVDAFLLRCNLEPAVGFKVIRKHLWLAAGHARARQFQYWQERSGKSTEEDDRNFGRIVRMAPADFIALLRKKGIPPSDS